MRLTQAELAKLLRVDRGTIRRWERGVGTPSTEHVLALWDLLDCALTYLLDMRDEPERSVFLTDNERQLLSLYRELPPARRAAAIEMLATLRQVERINSRALEN